ncbi:MAG TPA: M23 family metallopeptidase, partial [Prolixibacteraceae bacterium]|nr:M23 family metallopeptidase [Prolixibacteraceae bacterium]
MKKIMLTVWAIATVFLLNAQEKFYTEPVKIPVLLSGNFGELRGNHFHMGIDIKTEGRVGVPIHATAAGYISRISIAPAGFGNALYITHLNGTTSVYAHLLKFRKDIETYIRSLQYEKESFAIDWELPAGKFPVEKGEMIAQGGNSGSSAGPHLHFEIRDTRTQDAINPLKYNLFNIKDQTPPRVYAVQLYPLGDQSHVAGSVKKKRYQTVAAHG